MYWIPNFILLLLGSHCIFEPVAWCEDGSVSAGGTTRNRRAEQADHVVIHVCSEKEPELFESVAGRVGASLTQSNRLACMNIISNSDQKINGLYNTTSLMLLFDHKSTDNQHAAAFWSLLCTVVHKS